jgi:hypothetical protein
VKELAARLDACQLEAAWQEGSTYRDADVVAYVLTLASSAVSDSLPEVT